MIPALLAFFALTQAPKLETRRVAALPSVVVFVVDEAAVDDFVGLPLPNIDDLAARGVRFSAAYANPSCNVTRRSLYYGQWWVSDSGPNCGGSLNGNEPLASQISMAELDRRGASALFGKWHMGPDPVTLSTACGPLFSGFDDFLAGLEANVGTCGSNDYTDWIRVDDCHATHSTEYQPEAVLGAFLDWWTVTPGRKLAVFCANLAHVPFHVPPAHLLPPGYPEPVTNRQKFLSMLVAYDTLIGQALSVVNSDTLVIVVSDNGTPQNAGGGNLSKGTVYERGIHVPLIVAGPGVRNPGRTSDALVHVVDLYATVAEFFGAPAPVTDGLSLLPALADLPFAGHEYVLCGDDQPPTGDPGTVCVRSRDFKLRRVLTTGSEQFYVLPNETTNRINDPALAALVAAHRAWLDSNLP